MSHTIAPLPQHHTGGDPEIGPTARIVGWTVFLGLAFWSRLWILGLWIFSYLLGDAYDGWIVPVLGFILLPWTTLMYAAMWSISSDGVNGWEWIVVVISFMIDLAFWAWLRSCLRE